jgi:hypothetical protein
MWKAMLIVPEDFVCCAGINNWQAIDSAQNVVEIDLLLGTFGSLLGWSGHQVSNGILPLL